MQKFGSIIVVAAIACGAAMAQKDTGVMVVVKDDPIKLQAEGLTRSMTTARFGLAGPTVKGAPYSADGITETTQTLGDGTHINRQETYAIYRDGEGRVRRESGDQVWISDPVENVSYMLNTKEQTARKLTLSRTVAFRKAQLDDHGAKLMAEARFAGPVLATAIPDGRGEGAKTEALGKQEMEGVEVDGTRSTTVIPLGQIGNDRPLQIVHERWESAELHVTVLVKHTDPMGGDRVERLTNIRRGEPDPALFQVPAGYKVESDQ